MKKTIQTVKLYPAIYSLKNTNSTFLLKCLICFLFLLASFFLSAKDNPQIEFAKSQIDQKFYKAAISTLNSYLSTNKLDKNALYWKGYCYYKLENYVAATTFYEQVLKQDKKYLAACIDMANILTKQKKYDEAIPFYNAAIDIDNSDLNIVNSRGMCFYYADMMEPAIRDFRYVISKDSLNYLAYNNKGSATYNNQNIASASVADLKLAESDFNTAIVIKPDFELAFRNRGIVRYYLDDLNNAYKDLLYATQLDKNDENAHFYLGKVLAKQKNYPIALQFFDNAVRLVNYKYEYFLDRGICKLDAGNIDDAKKDLLKALQLTNNKGIIYYQLARIYAADGNKNNAYSNLRMAKQQGLFKDAKYFSMLSNDIYFKAWEKDKDYFNLVQELKFGK